MIWRNKTQSNICVRYFISFHRTSCIWYHTIYIHRYILFLVYSPVFGIHSFIHSNWNACIHTYIQMVFRQFYCTAFCALNWKWINGNWVNSHTCTCTMQPLSFICNKSKISILYPFYNFNVKQHWTLRASPNLGRWNEYVYFWSIMTLHRLNYN